MTAIALPQLKGQDKLTHSRMTTAKTCARKELIAYGMGIRPKLSARPLRMGGAVHVGRELFAKGEPEGSAIEAAVTGYEVLPPWANTDETIHEWLIERETVARLLAGYKWRWGVADGPNSADPVGIAEQIAAEFAFEIPIRNPETGARTPTFTVAGKIDGIVRLTDGRLAVYELKTCGDDIEPGSDYRLRLKIDQQISLYMIAARESGYDVQTVLYDMIRKPRIGPLQVPILDDAGFKIVLDREGNRVRTKDGKKWRESGDSEQGYTLQARIQTPDEFGERLTTDIVENPGFYYQRTEVPRLDADLEDFRHELWQMQQAVRESYKTGRHFRNTASCVGFGKCAYFDICTNGTDVTNGTVPAGFERVEDIHPELAFGE